MRRHAQTAVFEQYVVTGAGNGHVRRAVERGKLFGGVQSDAIVIGTDKKHRRGNSGGIHFDTRKARLIERPSRFRHQPVIDRVERRPVDIGEHCTAHPVAVEQQGLFLVPFEIPRRADTRRACRPDTDHRGDTALFGGLLHHQTAQAVPYQHYRAADPALNGADILDVVLNSGRTVLLGRKLPGAFMIAHR